MFPGGGDATRKKRTPKNLNAVEKTTCDKRKRKRPATLASKRAAERRRARLRSERAPGLKPAERDEENSRLAKQANITHIIGTLLVGEGAPEGDCLPFAANCGALRHIGNEKILSR